MFVTFGVIREKQGLMRNNFLYCMMELRKREYDDAQGDVQNAKIATNGHTFRKI
jgi:hypothetical protein